MRSHWTAGFAGRTERTAFSPIRRGLVRPRATPNRGRHSPFRPPGPDVTKITHVRRGRSAARVKATSDLPETARECGESSVYVVEVCHGWGWNHRHVAFVIGTGDDPPVQGGPPFEEIRSPARRPMPAIFPD
ncbi:DUF5318 family protein [Microtetraspora glauca]|uniref:DUF5318 family protein n=1 Tax=Microtetraspora glauca TaxID=1996 RepID=A0ABV3GJT4_MICGL